MEVVRGLVVCVHVVPSLDVTKLQGHDVVFLRRGKYEEGKEVAGLLCCWERLHFLETVLAVCPLV